MMRGQGKVGFVSINAIACAILLLAIAALTYRNIGMTRPDGNWAALSQATYGVLEGRPHWRAYQNRLLGPLLTSALRMFTGGDLPALRLFIALALGAQITLLFTLLRKAAVNRTQSLLWVACWAFAFTSLQHFWLYTWDFIDILVFTFLAFSLAFKRWLGISFALYFVAILNRESALFIPCGLILLEMFTRGKGGLRSLAGNRRIWVLAAAIVLGMVYTKVVRDWLFVSSFYGGPDHDHAFLGNHFTLWTNLQAIAGSVFGSGIVYVAPLLLACGGALFLVLTCPAAGLRAGAAVFLLYVANIIAFGLVTETRMLFPLLGFMIFGIVRYQELTRERDIVLHYKFVTSPKRPA